MSDMFTEEEKKSIHTCYVMKIMRTSRKLHIHTDMFHSVSAHSFF